MAIQPDVTNKLYDGKIEIGFWESRHRYSLMGEDGKWMRTFLISVTGATGMIDKSRVLMKWAQNLTLAYLKGNVELLKKSTKAVEITGIIENAVIQHQMVKEEAASIGSQVHQWCEEYINTGQKDRTKLALPEDESVLNGVMAFLKWVKDNKVKFIEAEKLVYSKEHDYVGLMDLKAKVNGKLTCVDFKTSSGIYPEYDLQVTAYRAADEEESGEKYDQSIILHFDKTNGDLEIHKVEDHDYSFKTFLACLDIKRWKKATDTWGK